MNVDEALETVRGMAIAMRLEGLPQSADLLDESLTRIERELSLRRHRRAYRLGWLRGARYTLGMVEERDALAKLAHPHLHRCS